MIRRLQHKYRIGITEAGDAGIDLSWADKMHKVDGAILITKNITPSFITSVMPFVETTIVHATITGYGSTIVEPNVPQWIDEYEQIHKLIQCGFPKEKIVIRVDPIVPTEKGIYRASSVIEHGIQSGFTRFRVSVLDMYPHVRQRFINAGLPDPYNGEFQATTSQFEQVDRMLTNYTGPINVRIEACAEPRLKVPIQCGCISPYDLTLLGLHYYNPDSYSYQRANCMCYGGKTELLTHKTPCVHGCLYCYWKSDDKQKEKSTYARI